MLDFYPRPPRGGRQLCPALFPDVMGISIHALREEGDSGWKPRPPLRCNFYPRPPRGGRHDYLRTNVGLQLFLSTPSARRATRRLRQGDHSQMISIHALREEGDCFPAVRPRLAYNFYPRPPRGGRPIKMPRKHLTRDISIHALREEGDRRTAHTEHRLDDFYPRPPRGGRLRERFIGGRQLQHFYPRPPRGGRHHQPVASSIPNPISIHALREEGDAEQKAEEMKKFEFLSTPSARRATRQSGPTRWAF